jgi:protein SCO1/2
VNPRTTPERARSRTGWSLLLAGLAIVLAGCDRPGSSDVPGKPPAPAPTSAPVPKHAHSTTGLVREIAPDRRSAVIRHEEIPGYMPRMTMELNVRETNELSGIAPGDTIAFRLLATDDTHWIEGIRRLAAGSTNPAPPDAGAAVSPRPRPLKPGDPMPEARFTDENARTFALSDLRGQAVAFTFFFTRCPLPDFCPRMNQHLAAARKALVADAQAPTNWIFLSISFDPEFDRPAVLQTHARTYRGMDPDRWLFAVADLPTLRDLAPRLDLRMTKEAGSISHNLRTVVLDPSGRIHRQFDGNRWTPAELAAAVAEAARTE